MTSATLWRHGWPRPESAWMADTEQGIIDLVSSCYLDPLRYVQIAFPWGQGELARFDGPDEWQIEILAIIRDKMHDGVIGITEAIQIAVASGHGIGKSALVAWVILWAISTREDTKGVVTANTESQLKTKTWAELSKWHRLCLNSHWFSLTATAIFSKDSTHEKTWRVDQVVWSERNTEAFAGLHNQGGRVLLIFDEASAIPDLIWEVSEGALTDADTEIIWAAFGNPTRTIGRFRECFAKFKHRWVTRQIDSRTVKITNKVQLQKFVDDYGEDSDFVRVRIKGQFPRASADALLGPDDIDEAMQRSYPLEAIQHAPVVLGGDVARQGDDQSALARRQGLVMYPIKHYKIPDSVLVAGQFAMEQDEHQADAMFIDSTGGWGAGVVDTLRHRNYAPIEVYFSGKATDARYFNKRSEMYFELANWIKEGGALPYDPELKEELCAVTFTFQGDKFRLCEKDDIKDQIGRSPDKADACALTFAYNVQKRSSFPKKTISYDPIDLAEKIAQSRSQSYDPYDTVKYPYP